MKGLRRELFRCFSCILILGSKRTNFSHKKTLHGEHFCHSMMHEMTFAARFHWRRFVSLKNEICFFFSTNTWHWVHVGGSIKVMTISRKWRQKVFKFKEAICTSPELTSLIVRDVYLGFRAKELLSTTFAFDLAELLLSIQCTNICSSTFCKDNFVIQ